MPIPKKSEIESWSEREKIQVMQSIYESLEQGLPEDSDLTEEEIAELDRLSADMKANAGSGVSWEHIKSSLS